MASTARNSQQAQSPEKKNPAAVAAMLVTQKNTKPKAKPLLDADGKLSSAGAATSLKHAKPRDLPSFPVVGLVDTETSAGTAATLAAANRKTFEHWKPDPIPEANKAAYLAKDYTHDPLWQPEQSAAGSKAAKLAAKHGGEVDLWKPEASREGSSAAGQAMRKKKKPATEYEREEGHNWPLKAATDAVSHDRMPKPFPPLPQYDYPDATNSAANALSAASQAAHTPRPRKALSVPNDLPGLSASDARRIHDAAITNMSREMYTAAPPVKPEVEERNRQAGLNAAAVSMARSMMKVQQKLEEDSRTAARSASSRKSTSSAPEEGPAIKTPMQYLTLQETARKLAQERLSRIDDDGAGYRAYYGQNPQSKRGFSIRRPQSSGESSDPERARRIRSEMTGLQSSLQQVDEKKRKTDRESLLAAAQRNVRQSMHGLDERVYAETGKASPAMQEEWREKARVKAKEKSAARMTNYGKVDIGGGKFLDQSEIDAIAAARVQPQLDEISEKAAADRARDEELRKQAEERREEAAEKQRQEKERSRITDFEWRRFKGEEKAEKKKQKADEKARKAREKAERKEKEEEAEWAEVRRKEAEKEEKAEERKAAAEKRRAAAEESARVAAEYEAIKAEDKRKSKQEKEERKEKVKEEKEIKYQEREAEEERTDAAQKVHEVAEHVRHEQIEEKEEKDEAGKRIHEVAEHVRHEQNEEKEEKNEAAKRIHEIAEEVRRQARESALMHYLQAEQEKVKKEMELEEAAKKEHEEEIEQAQEETKQRELEKIDAVIEKQKMKKEQEKLQDAERRISQEEAQERMRKEEMEKIDREIAAEKEAKKDKRHKLHKDTQRSDDEHEDRRDEPEPTEVATASVAAGVTAGIAAEDQSRAKESDTKGPPPSTSEKQATSGAFPKKMDEPARDKKTGRPLDKDNAEYAKPAETKEKKVPVQKKVKAAFKKDEDADDKRTKRRSRLGAMVAAIGGGGDQERKRREAEQAKQEVPSEPESEASTPLDSEVEEEEEQQKSTSRTGGTGIPDAREEDLGEHEKPVEKRVAIPVAKPTPEQQSTEKTQAETTKDAAKKDKDKEKQKEKEHKDSWFRRLSKRSKPESSKEKEKSTKASKPQKLHKLTESEKDKRGMPDPNDGKHRIDPITGLAVDITKDHAGHGTDNIPHIEAKEDEEEEKTPTIEETVMREERATSTNKSSTASSQRNPLVEASPGRPNISAPIPKHQIQNSAGFAMDPKPPPPPSSALEPSPALEPGVPPDGSARAVALARVNTGEGSAGSVERTSNDEDESHRGRRVLGRLHQPFQRTTHQRRDWSPDSSSDSDAKEERPKMKRRSLSSSSSSSGSSGSSSNDEDKTKKKAGIVKRTSKGSGTKKISKDDSSTSKPRKRLSKLRDNLPGAVKAKLTSAGRNDKRDSIVDRDEDEFQEARDTAVSTDLPRPGFTTEGRGTPSPARGTRFREEL